MQKNQSDKITTPVFASPFYKALAGHSQQLGELGSFLLQCESEQFRHQDSPQAAHPALFESRFDLFSWTDDRIRSMKNRLYSHLMNYLTEVNGFDQAALGALQFQNESWFHITRRGGFFQPHTHPLAAVSMIYCVSPGDEVIENLHEQGRVQFFDARNNASMYLDPANRHMNRTYSFNALQFRLQADEVCIFPSYLQHSVEPYSGDSPRITIAANFKFGIK